ncbi:MAG: hypothetical protein LBT77_00630 [Mycoplasmataceae bacterium]|nr:hypothetical protein [Mycoplasmataceae bacterium]
MNSKKKELGQFFTKKNIWLTDPVQKFIKSNFRGIILDPFAGAGDILQAVFIMLKSKVKLVGFDIDKNLKWKFNDSLNCIPIIKNGFIVTNPPYLSKNSCKRNKFNQTYNKYFMQCKHEDLYMIALEKMIQTGLPGIAVVPETFINSSFPKHKINLVVIIEPNPFDDTEVPICVVCFNEKKIQSFSDDYLIYKNYDLIGKYSELFKSVPNPNKILKDIRFNDKFGNIAIRGIDSTNPEHKIKFCLVGEINYDLNKISSSSRSITVVSTKIEYKNSQLIRLINNCNLILNKFRSKTKDVLLSPFKGNNKNGVRRRRLDYFIARQIISKAIETI